MTAIGSDSSQLNSGGTDYLRKLRKLDNIIVFLDALKEKLGNKDQEIIDKSIDVLVKYGNNLTKDKERED